MTSILWFVALGYLAICAYMYLMQDKLIFPAHLVEVHTPSKSVEPYEMKAHDGVTLRGAVNKGAQAGQPLMLVFSGNAQDNTRLVDYFAQNFPEINTVGLNYRGYVDSEGFPTEQKLFSDALAFYEKAVAELKPSKVVIYGYSLGSGVASYVVGNREVDSAILTVPFDSILNVSKGAYPWLPVELLLKYHFSSIKYLKGNTTPKAILSVEDDLVVPNDLTKNLINHIQNVEMNHQFSGIEHGEVLDFDGAKLVHKQAFELFLRD